jgi:pyruvate formate lyase activating enzyme
MSEGVTGTVFNIQHYSIHDGPGIRTTVFVNGCPLRCAWCQNPESQTKVPRLFFTLEKCTGCGKCVDICPQKATSIVEGHSRTNREICRACGTCLGECPNEARALMGRQMTAQEVFEDVNSDSIFYKNSGGGVTVSGGDPLAQPDFVIEILRLCKQAGMHTAIDTSGYANWETFKRVLQFVDLVLFDFKHMDPEEHKRCTGVSNNLILENAKKIIIECPSVKLLARIPVVPGYNDSKENIIMTARFISKELGKSIKVHLLPYHRMAETKYERLEEPQLALTIEPPSDEYMEELRKIVESFGLVAVIGG